MPQKAPNAPVLTPIRPKLPKSSGVKILPYVDKPSLYFFFLTQPLAISNQACASDILAISPGHGTHTLAALVPPAALAHRQCWEGAACQKSAGLVALFSHRLHTASPWLMHLLARGPGGTSSHCTARLYVPSDKKRGHLKVGVGGPCRARWDLGTLRWGGRGDLGPWGPLGRWGGGGDLGP